MREAHDKIAAGLEDALGIVEHLAPIDPAVAEAVSRATAWSYGHEVYRAYKVGAGKDASEPDRLLRETCIDDGLMFLRYLRTIGFDIVKLENRHA